MTSHYYGVVKILVRALAVCGLINVAAAAGGRSEGFEKHAVSPGLVMAGYQGWFDTPGDGANRGWYHPSRRNSYIARNHGQFFWRQLSGAASAGAQMVYVAMFDEIDEGTAIFKISRRVPVGESKFVPLDDDIPSDHYLWLAGRPGG